MLLAFHKPYGVLSQFTPDGSAHRTLAEFGFPPGVYPIGRLDADSEGLLLLSDEARWNGALLDPGRHVEKTYRVLVERMPSAEAVRVLCEGVMIDGKKTLPARAVVMDPQPDMPLRDPPVRVRKTVEDFWLELRICEGRNRQVRRMTAAIGHPTIRLIRVAVGGFAPGDLIPGTWREMTAEEARSLTPRPV